MRLKRKRSIAPGVFPVGPGRFRIVARLKLAGGRILQKVSTITGTKDEAREKVLAFKKELRDSSGVGSLKADRTALRTFGEVLRFYRDAKGYGAMDSTFLRMEHDLDAVPIREVEDRLEHYLETLGTEVCPTTQRVRKGSTVNRYAACANMAFAYALRKKRISGNPMTFYEREDEEARDRVLSADEELRLLSTLQRLDSHLYWPVRFSLHNPIRRGDLRKLTWDNFDETKPWVHFYPEKTRRRKQRETCLPFLDADLLEHWRELRAQYPDNPYLFPRIEEDGVYPLGDFKRHWYTVLRSTAILDFHWHDLKHCAITWVLDNGYTERDLKNLGIQYTDAMIDRYYKHDANKVLERYKRVSGEHEVNTRTAENG